MIAPESDSEEEVLFNLSNGKQYIALQNVGCLSALFCYVESF